MQRSALKWSISKLRLELTRSSIKYQSMSKEMTNFGFNQAKGICSVCAGQCDGSCYCHALIISDDDWSSHLQSIDESSHHQNFISNKEESSTGLTIVPQIYHRKRKDNIAHKRFSTILRKIYKRLGKDIDELLMAHYHRKDFFVIILNCLEREGQLEEAEKDFQLQMVSLIQKITNEMQEQPDYLEYLISLAEDHQKAFCLFRGDDWRGALDTLFHPREMRQRRNFTKSVKMVGEIRKTMGLPF